MPPASRSEELACDKAPPLRSRRSCLGWAGSKANLRMSDPPEDRVVPIRSLQGARLDARFDATLADLEARRDELVRVISRLAEGLEVIDQAGAGGSAQSARELLDLLATAKAELDEVSAIIEKLRSS